MIWTLKKVYLLSILLISIGFIWKFHWSISFFASSFTIINIILAVFALLSVSFLWFLAKRVPLLITLCLAFLLSYFAWISSMALVLFLFFGHLGLSFDFVPSTPFSVYTVLSLTLVNIFSSYGGWQNKVKKIEYTLFSQPVDNFENKVLRYIRKHDGKIRISECAAELKVTENEVKMAIQSLESKDLLKINK
jgi:hypothetical protein